jgi:hypothetical protein
VKTKYSCCVLSKYINENDSHIPNDPMAHWFTEKNEGEIIYYIGYRLAKPIHLDNTRLVWYILRVS